MFALVLMWGFVAVEFGWGEFQRDNKPGALYTSVGSVSVSSWNAVSQSSFSPAWAPASMEYQSVFNNWVSACFYCACLNNISNGCRAESHVVGPCRKAKTWKQVSVSWRRLLWNCRIGMLTFLILVCADDRSQFGHKAFCTCKGPDAVACARQSEQTHHLLVCSRFGHAGWQLYTLHEVFRIPHIWEREKKSMNLAECNMWGHLRIPARAF